MTVKQHLAQVVANESKMDMEFSERIVDIVYNRDFAVFASQMGDYDHPGERMAAYERFEKAMKELGEEYELLPEDMAHFYDKYFATGGPVVDAYDFHNMNFEYEA